VIRRKHDGQRRPAGDLRRTVRLFRRFMGGRKVYVLGTLFLVIEAVTAVFEPWPIAFLIDFLQGARESLRDLGAPQVLASERFETILLLTIAIIGIATVNSAADSLTEVCMARGGRSLGYSIRVEMYSHLQRLPLGYHDKKRTGDVLTRVTGDVLVVEDFVVKSVSNIVGSLMVLVGSFVFLLWQSWTVALVAIIVVPALALVSNHYSRRIKVASKTQRDREGDLASTAQEMLSSIRLVQSYGRGTVDLEKFSDQTGSSMLASLKAANIQAKFSFVIALVEALSISAVVWLGVWLVDRSAISIGTLVLFVLLLQNMFKPARKIVSEWYKIGKVFASVERIDDLLDREVVVTDSPHARPAPPLEGRLTFQHISFTYPAEHEDGSAASARPQVLRDIDFDVAPGEVVALVGFSGAGKSTIAQLVPRLYDPDSGAVLVDGMDVRGLTLSSLRSQVSLVLQETVLLSGTVAENIGYGIADATREDIEAAARMANAHDFIMAMPDGYDTVLGERGSTLSGGQRQRLAIARAFIRRAPILILDEPTTGLDAESAQTVVSALRDLMRGSSTIVISHDPGLVQGADRVLVISRGRIVESGTPESLMRGRGHFAELYAVGPGSELAPTPEPVAEVPPAVPVSQRLHEHLPGLVRALDPARMAERIGECLLDPRHWVRSVSAGTFWLRDDGSCTLRYRVRVVTPEGAESEHVVLGRVHQDEESARAYLEQRVRPQADGRRAGGPPWRQVAAAVPEAGLVLHVFPVDPDLPTLRKAMSPRTVARLAHSPFSASEPPQVEVVHHPREGACVLRYTLAGEDGSGPRRLYGKVYPGLEGEAVDSFLRALGHQPGGAAGGASGRRFPEPVIYAPGLHLLVTEALPGEPVIPTLLGSVLATPLAAELGKESAALHAAVRAAGEALALMHGSDLATAPVHTATDEKDGLLQGLDVVSRLWPEAADRVRASSPVLLEPPPEAPDVVLSHGDFTPSQVLLDGRNAAVVDLDTLCWADPALDLGRFIAHLELLAAKRGGRSGRVLARELARSFLAGYGGVGKRTSAAASAFERITFYRSATLSRSALRAARQLKAYRLDLALSLLESRPTRRVDQ
jgi:ABC-type multidrug transport system fused ATPase/permease subunit